MQHEYYKGINTWIVKNGFCNLGCIFHRKNFPIFSSFHQIQNFFHFSRDRTEKDGQKDPLWEIELDRVRLRARLTAKKKKRKANLKLQLNRGTTMTSEMHAYTAELWLACCTLAAHGSKNPIALYQEMWLQRWLRVSELLSAATSQRFNWSGPRPGTWNFL